MSNVEGPNVGGRNRPEGWLARSPVPSAMLNPSMVAVLLSTAADGYRREADEGMPWALSFVIAPLILHRGTREALPSRISSHISSWVSREPAIRAGFPLRALSLVEPVREGLRFGLRYNVLALDAGRIVGRRPIGLADAPELGELIAKATFAGRWLTKLDRPSTAFALLGVRV